MRKLTLAFGTLFVASTLAFAGPEPYSGKEMKQVVPPPCPQWYADSEWNITLWGAYAFGGGDDGRTVDETDLSFDEGERVHFSNGISDGGGGGIDVKYFFHRYFGIGIEAYGLATDGGHNDVDPESLREDGLDPHDDNDGVGAVKGTFTLRFPIGCSRFAPYIFGGAGVLFGGGDETFVLQSSETWERHEDDDARFVGQVGGGFEVRFTPHIGWITDVSWNFTDDDDFGMVRGGINFAF